jgi:hypothetical protein
VDDIDVDDIDVDDIAVDDIAVDDIDEGNGASACQYDRAPGARSRPRGWPSHCC